MEHKRVQALLDQQFDNPADAVSPLEQKAVSAHIDRCAQCREHYNNLVRLERQLTQKAVPEAQLQRMRALGPPLLSTPKRTGFKWLAVPVAVAAATLLFVARPKTPELMRRGGAPLGKMAWVQVFESKGETTRPLREKLAPSAGLAFAYHNLKDSPFRFMAIAGLDAAGKLHWYHPAYRSISDSPFSVPIEPGSADRELPERVFANHAPGALQICALFTRTPLEIKALDQKIEQSRSWPKDVFKNCVQVEVLQ